MHTEASGTAPPDAFGPFCVLDQVGAGALGPVFRASDSDRGRLVAVKLFQLDLAPERVHLLVTELEALVAARLADPAIAAPIATGTDGVGVDLAQECVPANVDSRPGGARVFIDGKLIGTTPISVPQVGAGPHAIRLERDGYRRWSSSIRLAAGAPNRVTASLEK